MAVRPSADNVMFRMTDGQDSENVAEEKPEGGYSLFCLMAAQLSTVA